MELVLTAANLLAWCQHPGLDGELASAKPRALRYRLLHTAGRLVQPFPPGAAPLPHWPWANELAHAHQRLACSRSDPDRFPHDSSSAPALVHRTRHP